MAFIGEGELAAGVPSNFGFLREHDEQLVRLGRLAERYFREDPNTCLLKLRQLTELLAQLTATRVGSYASAEEGQYDTARHKEQIRRNYHCIAAATRANAHSR